MEKPETDLYILIRAIVRAAFWTPLLVLFIYLLHVIPIAASNAIINHFS